MLGTSVTKACNLPLRAFILQSSPPVAAEKQPRFGRLPMPGGGRLPGQNTAALDRRSGWILPLDFQDDPVALDGD